MKILDKITLILFSMIILILAVIMSLLVFGWVTPTVVLSVYGKIVMWYQTQYLVFQEFV